jgi:hypothetical protein
MMSSSFPTLARVQRYLGVLSALPKFPSRPAQSQSATAAPDPETERAFYLASESWFLGGDKATALKYAQRYTAPVLLDEFKALRAALGMDRQNPPSTTSNTPVVSTKNPSA